MASAKKADKLKAAVGANIDDSIGVRLGQAPTVATGPAPKDPRYMHAKKAKDAEVIPLAEIVPDPKQPRKEFAEEDIDRMAAQLREQGQLQSIRVSWDVALLKFVLVDGERRYRAAQKAGLKALTCLVESEAVGEADRLIRQIIANDSEPLKDIELARAIERIMVAKGLKQGEVGAQLNMSKFTVARVMSLLNLAPEVQEKIQSKELPAATAQQLTKLDPADQVAMAARIVGEGLSRDATAREVNVLVDKRADDDQAIIQAEIDSDPGEEAEAFGPGEDTPATGSRAAAVKAAKRAKPETARGKAKPDGRRKIKTTWHHSTQGFKITVERAKGLSLTESQTALELALGEVRIQIEAEANKPTPVPRKRKGDS